MVFGNTGDRSATGVGFTRNPATGANEFFGEFLVERAGRGRRRRHPHAAADRRAREGDAAGLQGAAQDHQRASRRPTRTSRTSSSRSRTTSSTCCRPGTASAPATRRSSSRPTSSPRSCVTPREALLLVEPERAVAAAGAGVRSGRVEEAAGRRPRACRPRRARRRARWCSRRTTRSSGRSRARRCCSSARRRCPTTSTAWKSPQGVLTATGGMTSHAAVVGRQMGKPSVVGAGELADRREGQDVHRRRPDAQGRRLGLVRRPHRRGEDRPGRDQAERDPAGARRPDEAGGVGHLPALPASC